MKTQKFGIEIEFNRNHQKKKQRMLSQNISEQRNFISGRIIKLTGQKTVKEETWKATFDIQYLLHREKKGGRREPASEEYKCEIVSPILEYEDLEDLQEIVRQLRHKGAFVSDQCGIHIHVDASRYTPQTLRNLVNIIASKEDILYKALQIDPARLRWCKKTNEQLIQTINKRKPKTMEELKDIWYEGSHRRRTDHYNDTRYHGLNLHATFTKGTVEFRLFNSTTHAGEIKAYIQFCLAVSHQALTQKKASARRTVTDNAKIRISVLDAPVGIKRG